MNTVLLSENEHANVGPIPASWTVKPLSAMFTFSGGYSASREQLTETGYLYLHYGDIHTSSRTVVDAVADAADIPRLDVPIGRVAKTSLLKDGDIVFVDASEDTAGASKHVLVRNAADVPFISGLHTIVAKGFTDDIIPDYRRYCFQSEGIRRQFLFYAVGTKVTGISKTNIAKILVPFPQDHQEQRAIADALSDADALIAALDRLIAKKRGVKQAAMQELLTGRTRLPGFSDAWSTKHLAEIGTFTKGRGIRKDDVVSEGLPCIRYGEIYTRHHDCVRRFYSFITPSVAAESQPLYYGDLLFAGSGETAEEIGKCVAFLDKGPVYAGGDIVILSPVGHDAMYLGYLMNHHDVVKQKMAMAQGDAVVHISATSLGRISVNVPRLDEQNAIAAVLTDMDAEIAALEARRDKARLIKEGMMQELLTGKVRLV